MSKKDDTTDPRSDLASVYLASTWGARDLLSQVKWKQIGNPLSVDIGLNQTHLKFFKYPIYIVN